MLDIGHSQQALALLKVAREDGGDGPVLGLLTGRALFMEGLPGEAEPLLLEAASRLKHDPRPWRVLGVLYAEQRRPDDALDALRKAVELDPDDAASWNNLGFLLYTSKRSPDAIGALQKAVSLDGTNGRYRRNLGFALFNEGRTTEAQQAFQASGSPADAAYNLGVAYELAGDDPLARQRYTEALEINPQHAKAREALTRLDSPPPKELP